MANQNLDRGPPVGILWAFADNRLRSHPFAQNSLLSFPLLDSPIPESPSSPWYISKWRGSHDVPHQETCLGKKLAANRSTAAHSTGPRTPEGKARPVAGMNYQTDPFWKSNPKQMKLLVTRCPEPNSAPRPHPQATTSATLPCERVQWGNHRRYPR